MNASNDLERDLSRWMAAVVPSRAPDGLATDVVERTRSRQPRPAWLVRLLESLMYTQPTVRLTDVSRPARIAILILLSVALLTGAVLVGSRLLRAPSLPPPFGVAQNGLLAVASNGSILLVRPDGTDLRRLDLPLRRVEGVTFSRNGQQMAAWSVPDAGAPLSLSLIVANIDGSGLFEFDPNLRITDPGFRIAWSPDDRRIAFSGNGDELFLADLQTRTIQRFPPDDTVAYRQDPAWAPDGRLAYRCVTPDRIQHVCVRSADLTEERVLTTAAGTDWGLQAPSWSSDGRFLTYQVDDLTDHGPAMPGYDVAVLEVATGHERILTRGYTAHTILPVFAPDDRHILFLTETGPGVVRADGTGGIRTFSTPVTLVARSCSWIEPSPDGRAVGCVVERQAMIWPIDGGEPTIVPLGSPAESFEWQRLAP